MDAHETHRLAELQRLAEACLATETPSAALAHEVAALALSLVGRRRGAKAGPPYRTKHESPDPTAAMLVALERCEAERDALRAELATLRRKPGA
ncbi:MAG: hypothetical protein IPJ34_00125 [Myxococcales bacterium]|nr:hypothetical protein [Myxococcales bacterium]